MVLLALLVALLLFALSVVYVLRHTAKAFELSARQRMVVAGGFLLLGPVPLFVLRTGAARGPSYAIGAAVVLGAVLSAMFLIVVDLALFLRRMTGRPATPNGADNVHAGGGREGALSVVSAPVGVPLESPIALGRRDVLRQLGVAGALGAGFGSTGYATFFGRTDYQIEDLIVRIPGLPRAYDGYTIAQFSDVHFGIFVGDAERRVAVELVRRARPDLVVLTGDLVDHDPAHIPQLGRLVRELGAFVRDGVAMVPGNHDHYAGIDEVLAVSRSAGGLVLDNSSRVVGDVRGGGAFVLAGVDYGVRADLDAALRGAPTDLPRVLLAHHPKFFDTAKGRVALQLSGHTHGGQLNPPIGSSASLLFDYARGHYEARGSHLYVNRGFGVAGPPMRLFSPPEMTRIVLVAG